MGDMGLFAPACETVLRLSELLEYKADFGIRLKAAYDCGDREMLKALADECDVIISRINSLRLAHRDAWMEYYKPFGWEVHDIRYGGLSARFDTVKERIEKYLEGKEERIEELEQERLRLDGRQDGKTPATDYDRFLWRGYVDYATAGIL